MSLIVGSLPVPLYTSFELSLKLLLVEFHVDRFLDIGLVIGVEELTGSEAERAGGRALGRRV